jgi:hypothetical protein
MKKIYLLLSFTAFTLAANAQAPTPYVLSGTTYTQNFDTIGTALPKGWACYYSATSASLGTAFTWSGSPNFGAYFDTTDCPSDVFGHGFKNSASADNGIANATATCTAQAALTNRAFGVRQSSAAGYDPGISFVFELANTTNISNIALGFKLQGLDIRSTRTTAWTVDYGIGASPTSFIVQAPVTGYMSTGNAKFTDTTVAFLLDAGASNQSQPVWIRISSLAKTSGSGSRTTSAIDDFNMTYTNVNSVLSVNGPVLGLKVMGAATSNNITLAYNVAKEGQYSLNICDITGRIVLSKQVELAPGGSNIVLNGLNLNSGIYIARITNNSSSGTAKVVVQ